MLGGFSAGVFKNAEPLSFSKENLQLSTTCNQQMPTTVTLIIINCVAINEICSLPSRAVADKHNRLR